MCFNFIKKLRIPHGIYCYQPLRVISDPVFGFKIETRVCPFYKSGCRDPLYGWCELIEDEIVDQCKLCGINNFTDKEIERSGE
jgi:hypothetical protein